MTSEQGRRVAEFNAVKVGAEALTHETHKTRYSDSSVYDEICTVCGATDARGFDALNKPCAPTAELRKARDMELAKDEMARHRLEIACRYGLRESDL
jgi:ketol-acid reductoisomerase